MQSILVFVIPCSALLSNLDDVLSLITLLEAYLLTYIASRVVPFHIVGFFYCLATRCTHIVIAEACLCLLPQLCPLNETTFGN